MSARDLAALRTAPSTPPPPDAGLEDLGAGGAAAGPGLYSFHESPSAAAFALSKEAAVNFREITAGDTYRRVVVESVGLSPLERGTLTKLRAAILLRDKWVFVREVPEWSSGPSLPEVKDTDPKEPTPAPPYHPFDPPLPEKMEESVEWRHGVAFCVSGESDDKEESRTYAEFAGDMERIMGIVNDPGKFVCTCE